MKRFSLKVLNTVVLAGVLALPISAIAADDLSDLLVKKGTITKEEADSVQKRSIASFIDKITLYGDFRLREETMWYPGDDNNTKDVNRQRFRLRIGSDITEGPVLVHIRLASGVGQQVSTNQTMQSLSSGKQLWIDKAYVELKQIPDLNLMGGRMTNPFFINWGTGEIVWDDDYNPEGFAEQYALKLGDTGRVFATLGQIILDGGAATSHGSAEQWLMGYQVGTEIKMDPVGFNLAVLYYSLDRGTRSDLGYGTSIFQDGNTRKDLKNCSNTLVAGNPTATPPVPDKKPANCALVNPYNVIDATAAVVFKVGLPITVSADYAENLADTVQTTSPSIKNQNTAYALGFKIGNASEANTAELGYNYRAIEADATLSDLNDSDFGPNGGTNRKGHVVWTAYNFTKATQIKLKYFNTKIKNEDLPSPPAITKADPNPTFNRVQLDFSVKF
jgi:hypothetical protein